ncbi:MAG: family 14 glycosylhydrolase [Magnetococcus sp. DMHC-1]
MAPLIVKDGNWPSFKGLLEEAKNIGVEAVTVDIWWGKVMQDRHSPDWEYYIKIFRIICDHGLDIVPIFSLHHGGGSVGDGNLNIPIPGWVYNQLAREAGLEPNDLKYESETGTLQSDALPVWATVGAHGPVVMAAVRIFFQAFTQVPFFQELAKAGAFPELNISLGPAGELRYPSYNESDGWKFPDRGFFQCYGRLARQSFREWAQNRLEWLERDNPDAASNSWIVFQRNAAHGTDLYENIRPPGGEYAPLQLPHARADESMRNIDYMNNEYGQDFTRWYHECLLEHGKTLLREANSSFSKDPFASIPLGMKIPGIHWQWRCTGVPRMAEITAGLIAANASIVPPGDKTAPRSTGYDSIFNMVRDLKSEFGNSRDIIVHFTALEMDSKFPNCNSNDTFKTSDPQTLVRCVANAAQKAEGMSQVDPVTLRGENALICVINEDHNSEVTDWEKIGEIFTAGHFTGFTLLRLVCTCWEKEKEAFEKFIKAYDTHRRSL